MWPLRNSRALLLARASLLRPLSMGAYYSMALSRDGEVLTWGDGESGQLGHGWGEHRNEPVQVELLAQKTVVGIAAGYNLTMAQTVH